METTQNQNFLHEQSQNRKVSNEGEISKKALLTFISGASIVFAFMLYYCFSTNYSAVAGVLFGAYVLVCIYAASVYKSLK